MDFIQLITENNGKVYLVGGTNRDRLFSMYHNVDCVSKDVDLLVGNMKMEILIGILREVGKVDTVGKSFGVIIFKDQSGSYDIALPRKEVSTGPGYRDFEIIADETIPIEIDLERRDATINAIAIPIYSIKDIDKTLDDIVDPFGGVDDIQSKMWRAVGDPFKRFLEDPVRILRAIRQCSQYDLELEEQTRDAILHHSDLINTIVDTSPVRLTEEFIRCLKCDNDVKWINFITDESEIGKYLGLVGKVDFKFLSNVSIPIRIAMILYHYLDTVEEVVKWTQKFELTAAPHFEKRRINMVIHTKKYLDDLDLVLNKIDLKRIIQGMGSIEDTITLIEMYECIRGVSCPDLYELLDEIDEIIYTKNDIQLDGHMINEEFGLVKKEIGDLKDWLFEQITLGLVVNNKEELILFVRGNYFT